MNDRLIHTTIGTAIKPTIFEILAQESFHSLVHSISKQLANVHISRFDEWFLCINFVLEYFYLRHQDASFSESFYGLRRAVLKDNKLNVLGNGDKFKALMLLTVGPYLKRKMDDYYSNVNHSTNIHERIFCKLHKIINVMLKTGSLALIVRYLVSDRVVPATMSTFCLSQQFHYKNNRSHSSSWIGTAFSTLEVVMFFVQFYDLWKSCNMTTQMKNLPPIEAPKKFSMANRLENICPICGKPWVAATVVPVSGCIFNYVIEHKKCPATGLPINEDLLIRLC